MLIVAGKGGVGKTTVGAAVALMAAEAGLEVLVIQLEPQGGVAGLLGHPEDLGYDEVTLRQPGEGRGGVRARALTPDGALLEYLADHGLGAVSRRLITTGTLDVISTAVPGIRDILVLGKVKQLERAGAADLVILDAPATGHALTFLGSAEGLVDVARVGPIRVQATEVGDLLRDPARCQVLLVTLPEETPVNETVETAHRLQDQVGVGVAGVVVNAVYPPLEGLGQDPEEAAAAAGRSLDPAHAHALSRAAAFRLKRQQLQGEQVARLTEALELPRLVAPYLFRTGLGAPQAEELSHALTREVTALAAPQAAEAGT